MRCCIVAQSGALLHQTLFSRLYSPDNDSIVSARALGGQGGGEGVWGGGGGVSNKVSIAMDGQSMRLLQAYLHVAGCIYITVHTAAAYTQDCVSIPAHTMAPAANASDSCVGPRDINLCWSPP